MKRAVLLFVALFGLNHATFAVTPITEFNPGHYSGAGTWLADDGSTGDFKTFLDVESDGWTVAKFMLGDLYVYETTTAIDEYGFLSALVIDASNPYSPNYYSGYGNCGSNYCQMTVYLYNGVMQKALVFNDDNTIDCVGAIFFNDGTPDVQWEGHNVRLP